MVPATRLAASGLFRAMRSQMRSKSSAAGIDQRTSITGARTDQGAVRLVHGLDILRAEGLLPRGSRLRRNELLRRSSAKEHPGATRQDYGPVELRSSSASLRVQEKSVLP